jgi:hypothetical protein
MELIGPDDIMCSIASQFVVHNRHIAPDCGVLMTLAIRADNHGYERNGNTFHKNWVAHYRNYLHYIIVKPHSVFVAITCKPDFRDVWVEEWRNTSNHDSCWRSDGFSDIFREVMKAYHACYDHVPKRHQPTPISSGISASLSPSLRQPINFVSISKRKSLDDDYRYTITHIRELNPKFPTLEGDRLHGW